MWTKNSRQRDVTARVGIPQILTEILLTSVSSSREPALPDAKPSLCAVSLLQGEFLVHFEQPPLLLTLTNWPPAKPCISVKSGPTILPYGGSVCCEGGFWLFWLLTFRWPMSVCMPSKCLVFNGNYSNWCSAVAKPPPKAQSMDIPNSCTTLRMSVMQQSSW